MQCCKFTNRQASVLFVFLLILLHGVVNARRPIVFRASGGGYYASWGSALYFAKQNAATFTVQKVCDQTLLGCIEHASGVELSGRFLYVSSASTESLVRYKLLANGVVSERKVLITSLDHATAVSISGTLGCVAERTEFRCYRIYAQGSAAEWWYEVGYYTYPLTSTPYYSYPSTVVFGESAGNDEQFLWLEDGSAPSTRVMRHFDILQDNLQNPDEEVYHSDAVQDPAAAQFIVLKNTSISVILAPTYTAQQGAFAYVFDPQQQISSGVPSESLLGALYKPALDWLALDVVQSQLDSGLVEMQGVSATPSATPAAQSPSAFASPPPSVSVSASPPPSASVSASPPPSASAVPSASTSPPPSASAVPSGSATPSPSTTIIVIPAPSSIPININDSTVVPFNATSTEDGVFSSRNAGFFALASVGLVPILLVCACCVFVIVVAVIAHRRPKRSGAIQMPGHGSDSAALISRRIIDSGDFVDVQAWAEPVYTPTSADSDSA